MGFKEEFKAALPEIFGNFSEQVQWKGGTYNCVIAGGQMSVEIESGGFVPDAGIQVKFLESELGGQYPANGDILSYDGQTYRIAWISTRKGRGYFEVQARPKNG